MKNAKELFDSLKKYTESELKSFIEYSPEDVNLEYKKNEIDLSNDVWETYSAFCNTEGGIIVLGISEITDKNGSHFTVTGVKNPKKIKMDFLNILRSKNKISYKNCSDSDIIEKTIDSKTIIIIFVDEVDEKQKPVEVTNKNKQTAYIRELESDKEADKEQLRIMIRDSSDDMDNNILKEYSMDDLDIITILKFRKKIETSYPDAGYEKLTSEELLIDIGALIKDRKGDGSYKLTIGALLFFGKYNSIVNKFPHYHLEFLDKRTLDNRYDDRVSSSTTNEAEMNLYNFYLACFDKLKSTIKFPFKLDENSETTTVENFKVTLREALANTLIHADYFSNYRPIVIEANIGYYLFSNPGKLKIKKWEYVQGGRSRPRNNIIMKLFIKAGISESTGLGGSMIFKNSRSNDFKAPDIDTDFHYTSLKIWCISAIDAYNVSDEDKRILKIIKKYPNGISKTNLIELSGKSKSFIGNRLDYFRKEKIVKKVGESVATKYMVPIDNDELIGTIHSMLDDYTKHIYK